MTELEKAHVDYFVLKTMHQKGVRRFVKVIPGPLGQPPIATMVSTQVHRGIAKRKIKALS